MVFHFILLTTFLIPIVILSNWDSIKYEIKGYIIIILLLESLLLGVFLVLDLIMFYIFFESILPPLFILIGIWGSKRRVRASFHIFLYTLGGSLFMLLAFLTMYFLVGSTDYEVLTQKSFEFKLQKILWIGIFLSIMVKSPLWPFHLWLPICHSEAPLGGSILLAGIILKLALYAVLRILLPILPEACLYFTPFVYTICIITIIYASLTTLRQIDLKVIVAYSSISHMAVTMMGAFSNGIIGIEGAILLGLAHGLVSPALFILLGGVLYDRYHTRIITYYRGLTGFLPLFSLIFFIFTLANMGTPLTGNFLGEFLCLAGAFQRSPILAGIASLSIILSAVYSIFLYNRISGGIKSRYIKITSDLNRREFYLLLPLLLGVILLGIYPNFILEGLHQKVSTLIYYI
jgi:NADH-ubiquinone oxidoreductase chain 4